MSVIHLGPGDVAIGKAGDELHTVLGSCVAVVLWEPHRHIAAMAHIALPTPEAPEQEAQLDTRRADHAWQQMCGQLARSGVSPSACVCKVFGGARVFDHRHASIGEKTVLAVRRLLEHHQMRVTSEHVGGTGYRELRMNVDTGDAWVRHRKGFVKLSNLGGES